VVVVRHLPVLQPAVWVLAAFEGERRLDDPRPSLYLALAEGNDMEGDAQVGGLHQAAVCGAIPGAPVAGVGVLPRLVEVAREGRLEGRVEWVVGGDFPQCPRPEDEPRERRAAMVQLGASIDARGPDVGDPDRVQVGAELLRIVDSLEEPGRML